MTLKSFFNRLSSIDREAQVLIRDTGFTSLGGLVGQVRIQPGNQEDSYLYDKIELLLQPLEELHTELRHIRRGTYREYTLSRFPNGRYGYIDEKGDIHTFSRGDPVDARIPSAEGHDKWVSTSMEHNGSDYYLLGYRHLSLYGLKVKASDGY